jgi:hypothetical protein
VKIYTHFVDGLAALADDDMSKKIVWRLDPKGPFFSRYEMSDILGRFLMKLVLRTGRTDDA